MLQRKLTNRHKNKPIYIVGGGTSLLGFNFIKLKTKITMACNSAALQFPAKYMVFLDEQFYKENKKGIQSFKGFKITMASYETITGPKVIKVKDWKEVKVQRQNFKQKGFVPLGLSDNEDDGLNTGGNSGFLALQAAYIMGCNPIYLMGIDLRFSNHKKYFYDGKKDSAGGEIQYDNMSKAFNFAAPLFKERGVKVYNCSPISKLEGYPYYSLRKIKFKRDY
jgi:hypothetical protein